MPLSRDPNPSLRRPLFRTLGLLLPFAAACSSLNYPEQRSAAADPGSEAATPTGTQAIPATPSQPALPGTALGLSDAELAALADERDENARSWYVLSRNAREARRVGDYDEASALLEQAAMQLEMRPGDNAERRAVHGMRARLALDLLAAGREEDAELLADTLFAEAEAEPEIGSTATIDLASAIVDLRARKDQSSGLETSTLPLMRIALQAAATEAPSRSRLELAYNVARAAESQGDPDLARQAIDRALTDSRILEPTKREQLATLELIRTRIAIAQGDLGEAERSAATANQLLEEIGAPEGSRAVGEATMAHAVAELGDAERAHAIAMAAEARLSGEQPVHDAIRRIVLGELARASRALGEVENARGYYRAALDVPASAGAGDAGLVSALARELAGLDDPADGPGFDAGTSSELPTP